MKDMLGQELHVGDYVAGLFSNNTTPFMFRIIGFTPKKVTLVDIHDMDSPKKKFPWDLMLLNREAVEARLQNDPTDALGQELKLGDYVFGSRGDYIDPVILEIVKFAPSVAKIKTVYNSNNSYWMPSDIRNTTDLIKIEPSLVTMHCLTKNS